MNNPNFIFALDIGTRSVVGLLLQKDDKENFQIVDIIVKEHEERAMLDGQIHDVLAVSKIILDIKDELSQKHGPLSKVCVAAAGRALKTKRAKTSVSIKGKPFMDKESILHIELSAVQQAQILLANEEETEKSHNYYCVGYSVLHYLLDGEEIGNLLDQQGDEAAVEVIATFLPKIVVESLLSALERADLEMSALTLEPIAAINVLIPPSMRRLNVALVDIGAGTSDIAITDMGTIIAYGMVPIAGDEITEAISDQFLLDFPLAEKAKRELAVHDEIIIQDILGFETSVSKHEIVDKISDSLNQLATHIANEILSLNNNKSPKAIMLVGGGSLTPELPKLLSEKLNLPANRIAIRGIDAIQKLVHTEEMKQSPELVTPIGIAIAASVNPVHYISVYVNERPVRLFDMKQLTVGDCLLTSGIEMNKLYGKPGMAMIVNVNGRDITIPGGHGQQPKLLKNGEITALDAPIEHGDYIFVEKGKDGQAQQIHIYELLEEMEEKQVFIDGKPYSIQTEILKNGKRVDINEMIEDNDTIESYFPKTISELFQKVRHPQGLMSIEPFYVYFNRTKVDLPEYGFQIERNGIKAAPNTLFQNNDQIKIIEGPTGTVKDVLDKRNLSFYYTIPIIFNGTQLTLNKPSIDIFRNGEELVGEDSTIKLGDHLQVVSKKVEPFIFQDIFRYIDIEMPTTNTKFSLLRNDSPSSFHEELAPGDELKLQWP